MAKGIENRARSPPAVFDFATSQIQKHGGTKMYYDLVMGTGLFLYLPIFPHN